MLLFWSCPLIMELHVKCIIVEICTGLNYNMIAVVTFIMYIACTKIVQKSWHLDPVRSIASEYINVKYAL